MESEIPIIDFSNIGIDKETYEEKEGKRIGIEFVNAFKKTGFVYLSNSGITSAEIERINKSAWELYSLPLETKCKYQTDPDNLERGYAPENTQNLSSGKRVMELRESCNFQDFGMPILDDLPELGKVVIETISMLRKLSYRVLEMLEFGLELETGCLISKHKDICSKTNRTCLRIVHYPPIMNDDVTNDNAARISAHTDFGTFTLLLQDSVGGLEIQNEKGEWIEVKPISDTVLVNACDLLQRWTSNKIKSTMHKVNVPDNMLQRKQSRQAMAFFVVPDNEVVVKPFGNSNAYEPINGMEYIINRYREMYL